MLALVPASIVGRGFLKSSNVPKALAKSNTPVVQPKLLSAKDFPDGWHLYESCGQSIFTVYGMSGGISAGYVAYLIRKAPVLRNVAENLHFSHSLGRTSGTYWDFKCQCIPIEFNDLNFISVDYDQGLLTELMNEKIRYAIANRKPRPFSLNGGDMGLVTPEERAHEAAHFATYIHDRLSELADHLAGIYPQRYGA